MTSLHLFKSNDCFRGGIRGIVELEVLRELERILGDSIAIQNFFDLIVGTRYTSTPVNIAYSSA